jgi:hypothetical protein
MDQLCCYAHKRLRVAHILHCQITAILLQVICTTVGSTSSKRSSSSSSKQQQILHACFAVPDTAAAAAAPTAVVVAHGAVTAPVFEQLQFTDAKGSLLQSVATVKSSSGSNGSAKAAAGASAKAGNAVVSGTTATAVNGGPASLADK